MLAGAGSTVTSSVGRNGEGPYLEPGERFRLVKAGRRRKSHFMVGIAAESTRVALNQVEEAIEGGADSILVMTPTTLTRGRDEAVLRFYKTSPTLRRHRFSSTRSPPSPGTASRSNWSGRLSRHDNIVGMKDSSGDVVRLQSIIDASPVGLPPLFRVLPGAHCGDGDRLSRGHHRIGQLCTRAGAPSHWPRPRRTRRKRGSCRSGSAPSAPMSRPTECPASRRRRRRRVSIRDIPGNL